MCMGGSGNGGVNAGAGEAILGAILTATGYGSSVGVPMILGGIGSAATGVAQQQQLNKQDQIAAEGIVQQGNLQKQGEGDVQQTTNTLAQSNANVAAKSAQQLQAFRAALEQGSAISSSASPAVPGASKAYKATQAQAGQSAQDYANAIASSAATTQGTQLERIGENEAMGNTASQLGVLSQQSNESNYVTQLKIRATQQNPWLDAFGQVMQGASKGYSAMNATPSSATLSTSGGQLTSAGASSLSNSTGAAGGSGPFWSSIGSGNMH